MDKSKILKITDEVKKDLDNVVSKHGIDPSETSVTVSDVTNDKGAHRDWLSKTLKFPIIIRVEKQRNLDAIKVLASTDGFMMGLQDCVYHVSQQQLDMLRKENVPFTELGSKLGKK